MLQGNSRRLAGALSLGAVLAGCYSLRPMRGVEPQPGMRVAFDVTDTGRVALGGAMGPQIAQVEGLLVDKDSTGYLVSVSTVRLIQGGSQIWSGEQIRLNPRFVASAYERKFSLTRTIGLGAVAAGGVAAFIGSISLVTGGSDGPGGGTDTVAAKVGRP
jgi:hypothetical protein